MFITAPRTNWLSFLGLLLVAALALSYVPTGTQAAPIPPGANPNYFYDRETAFIIAHAIDPDLGGAYLGLQGDGTPHGPIPATVWGMPASAFGGNLLTGSDRSLFGQGTCIRWFITEYQRMTHPDGPGIDGLNQVLVNRGFPGLQLSSAEELLTVYAASCADFVIDYMVIDQVDDGNNTEDNYNDIFNITNGERPDIGEVRTQNRLYYWTNAYVERNLAGEIEGTRFTDDTLHQIVINGGAPRAESIVPWTIAELARIMRAEGIPGWNRFNTHALAYWNWSQTIASPLPDYNVVPDPVLFPNDNFDHLNCGVGGPPGNPNRCLAGASRDIFIPALGEILTQINGGPYRATGQTFANTHLGPGPAPSLPYPPPHTIQDGAYIAGYARAIIYANEFLRTSNQTGQWWDFGNFPAREGAAGIWGDPTTYPSITNLNQPFAHFAGRELLTGVQRAFWFYYTFGENPNQTFPAPGTFANTSDMLDAIIGYWDYMNQQLWDTANNYETWWESTSQQYKPCFSAGTDLPIGDWLGPTIVDKVHTLNQDGSATVSVTGVSDDPFDYMSWEFAGSSVVAVEVSYSIDNGNNWIDIPAVQVAPQDYEAIIPAADIQAAQAAGFPVYYYARAVDAFDNWRSFPDGAEERDSAGVIIARNTGQSQTIGDVQDDDDGGEQTVELTVSGSLSVFKSVFPGVASIDEEVTWTLEATNTGNGTLNNIQLVDPIPAGLQVTSVSASKGTITVSGDSVIWSIPELQPGERVTATIITLITDGIPDQVVINEVSGSQAQVIVVTSLPATGERPWWAPCRIFGTCED